MKATLKAYDPQQDYLRIRDFLVETFALYQWPFNWLVDRWNFCRYFVLPCHTFYNVRYFGVPTGSAPPHRDELPFWEKTVGIWENEAGQIVGVVHTENEEPGEAWVQMHPDYTGLYEEMVTYIEEHLADRVGDLGYVKLYVNEGTELEGIAAARGYHKLRDRMSHKEYIIRELPPPQLPVGFAIKSVEEEDDPDRRSRAKAIAFGAHYAPSDWLPGAVMSQMQQAPDYRADLDLFIVGPDGEYVSFCTAWVDLRNRYGVFEPVGTQAEYQGMGLGRALLTEGFRRMARYGVVRSFMQSDNPFYRKVGFVETPHAYSPWIKHFRLRA